jgi:hypothetical protein
MSDKPRRPKSGLELATLEFGALETLNGSCAGETRDIVFVAFAAIRRRVELESAKPMM